MPVAQPGVVSALARLFRHAVWIGWLMISIVAAFYYVKKAEDGQSAFIRWRPQVLLLISGVNIYDTKMFPNPPIMPLTLYPLMSLPPVAGALCWFVVKAALTGVSVWLVLWLTAGQLPGDDAPDPGLGGDLLDLGGDLLLAAAGLPAGQGRGKAVQFPAGLGQGGAGEPGGLGSVQFRGVGQDGAALSSVGLAPGVAGGEPAEPVLVNDGSLAGRQGGQVRAIARRHGPDPVQPGPRQVREVRRGVLPGIEHHRHIRAVSGDPGRVADRRVLRFQLVDHARELGDIGLVAGIGMPGQRDPAVPGDHQAQPRQPQVRPFLLGLAPLRDRRLAVRRAGERGEVRHVQSDR